MSDELKDMADFVGEALLWCKNVMQLHDIPVPHQVHDSFDLLRPYSEGGWRVVKPGYMILPKDREEARMMGIIADAFLKEEPK